MPLCPRIDASPLARVATIHRWAGKAEKTIGERNMDLGVRYRTSPLCRCGTLSHVIWQAMTGPTPSSSAAAGDLSRSRTCRVNYPLTSDARCTNLSVHRFWVQRFRVGPVRSRHAFAVAGLMLWGCFWGAQMILPGVRVHALREAMRNGRMRMHCIV